MKHPLLLTPLGMVIAAGALLGMAGVALADVDVVVDQAKILRLPPRVATVVIGNPAIADVTLQRNGVAVLTGKSFGTTNMIILDPKGETISEEQVTVRAQDRAIVTVQRGLARESLSCSPLCERVARVGDAPENFDAVNGQVTARGGLASNPPGQPKQ